MTNIITDFVDGISTGIDFDVTEEQEKNNRLLELNEKTYDIIKIYLPGCLACQITLIVLALIFGFYTIRNNSKARSKSRSDA